MKPVAWLVTWLDACGRVIGSHSYPRRAEARGAVMMKRAQGWTVTIDAVMPR